MNNEGLYIRLLSDGTIKRRLITILGEVPLEDTTIAAQFASTDCPFRMSGVGSSVEAVWAVG